MASFTALVTALELMVAAVTARISFSAGVPALMTEIPAPLPTYWERKLSESALAPRPGVSEWEAMRTPTTWSWAMPTVSFISPPKPLTAISNT